MREKKISEVNVYLSANAKEFIYLNLSETF